MKVVIVGNGMAGARLASLLPELDVTVIGDESHAAYNRILLSSVLAGKHRPADISLPLTKALVGVTVTSIDRAAKKVSTSDGTFDYDHLVLATGSEAIVPPGFEDGLTFRTLDDCHRIIEHSQNAQTAIVLGGGLLGLEAARGLAGRGLKVEVVHAVGHLMERQLDPAGGAVLARTLGELGITVHLGASAVGWRGNSLYFGDGRTMAADLLVVACGVRPATRLAREADLPVERGIVVDARLRTSDRRISAIGDCAQFGADCGGLVAPAWEQAKVVAAQLTGSDPLATYKPMAPVTRLKASGINLAAMGTLDGEGEDISFADPVRGTYARMLIRDERVAGAVLLGDNPTVGQVIQLFDRKAPVPSDRRSLLLGRSHGAVAQADSPALMPDATTVCQCNTVTKGQLVRCGARTLDDAVKATRATTGCGSCRDAVEGIVDWMRTS